MLTLSLDQLIELYPDRLWIETTEADRQTAAEVEARPYSHAAARTRAYLNALCLSTLRRELPELLDLPDISVNAEAAYLEQRWEMVTGVPIQVGEVRLVVIPTDDAVLEELCVPREWVEIADWAAPYYVAVQVDLAEGWLQIAGYATHNQVRQGEMDDLDRAYTLPIADLIESLPMIWNLRPYIPDPQPEVAPLPVLDPAEADTLIQHYGQAIPYSPRLLPCLANYTFEHWLALMADPDRLHQLYAARNPETVSRTVPELARDRASEVLSNLQRQVTRQVAEVGDQVSKIWRSLDELMNPPVFTPAIAAKGDQSPRAEGVEFTVEERTLNLAVSYGPLTGDPPEISANLKVNAQDGQALPLELTLKVYGLQGEEQILITGDRARENQRELQATIVGEPGENYTLEISRNPDLLEHWDQSFPA